MRPECVEEAQWWFKQAESDFTALQILLKAKKCDVGCFLPQEAAGKVLKAHLLHYGEERVISHSIAELCDAVARFDEGSLSLKRKIKGLTPFLHSSMVPQCA